MEIQSIYEKSFSRRDFFAKLEKAGAQLSLDHTGIPVGILDDQGHQSFEQLGISRVELAKLDLIQDKARIKVYQRLNRIDEHLGLPKQQKSQPKKTPKH